MRRLWVALLVLVTVTSLGIPGVLASGSASAGRGGPEENFKLMRQRERQFLREHSDRFGRVRPDLWQKGIARWSRLPISATWPRGPVSGKQLLSASGPVTGAQWTQIGPQPLRIDAEQNFQGAGPDSGEVVDVAIDPRNSTDDVMFIATNGGVWKTSDGGASWDPKTDFMPSISIGDVSVDPGNPSIVYAGTGNLFDGAGQFNGQGFNGVGIYKSVDDGDTWTVQNPGGIFTGVGINRIVFPAANVLLVGTDIGVFKSVDGGLTFGNNSPSFNNGIRVLTGFISDLDLDSATTSTAYASVRGSGVFVSTDSGSTFPTNLAANTGFPPPAPPLSGFIGFTQSTQPDNQTMYVSVQGSNPRCTVVNPANSNRCAVIAGSLDGGANWTELTNGTTQSAGCQCGYDQMIGVDPLNEDRLFIGFQELYRSTNATSLGASTFANVSANLIHFDHHAMTFSPASHDSSDPATIYTGTDGGVHRSTDGGTTWDNSLNETIATNLLFTLDIGRGSGTNNQYSYGGTQDTGTIDRRPGDAGLDWHESEDGDGGAVAVDPANGAVAFLGGNRCYKKTTNGGNSWATPAGVPAGVCASQLAIDPNDSDNVFVASGNQIYRSTTGGGTLSLIGTLGANVRDLDMTAVDSNVLWVGLASGQAARSTDALAGGPTFTTFSVTGAPSQVVTGIAVDPTNTDVATVVYPGFNGSPSKHVFQTTNGGSSWTNVSGNLPDLPLHSVVVDPGTSPHSLIVSSDAGVARSVNGGVTWQQLGVGLPKVLSKSLQIDSSATPAVLRIGTYGRSVFELTPATGPSLAVNGDLAFGPVAVGQFEDRIVQLFNVGSADLDITSFERVAGSSAFEIVSGPPTPVTVPPGEEVDYTVRFTPPASGPFTATFQVESNDPFDPHHQIPASGTGVTGDVALSADDLQFGGVPVDDRTSPHESAIVLQITNQASCEFCDLTVNSLPITGTNASDFSLVGAPSLPVTIGAGSHLDLTVKFDPSADGARFATLTVNTDDPDSPSLPVSLSGTGLLSAIGVVPDPIIFGPTVFDPQCGAACGQTIDATVTNTGQAELIVDAIVFSDPAFTGPLASAPPARVAPNASFLEPVTFRPTGGPDRSVDGSLSITHNVAGTASIVVQEVVPLCGESVGRGIRVLVLDPAGNTYSTVDRITLQSFGLKKKINVDVRDAPLTTIMPPASCQEIDFHYENQDLPAAGTAVHKGSYYALKVTQGNKSTSLSFTLNANEFKTIVVTVG